MYNILVCDDEKAIVDAIEIYLLQEKYNVIFLQNLRTQTKFWVLILVQTTT